MEFETEPSRLAAACTAARVEGRSVGLILTMGALHEGHLSLVRRARNETDFVATTIFVNPLQFGPKEDLSRYPRRLNEDAALLHQAGADFLLAPEASSMYPAASVTHVTVAQLTENLCGPHRPGHFEGVATVVTKFFGLAGACKAYFGQKDYQQLKVIEALARDLFLPIEVVGVPTVRDADGLALSSRNQYLSHADRAAALSIPHALQAAARAWAHGEHNTSVLERLVRQSLSPTITRVDYVQAVDAQTLAPVDDVQAPVVLAVAAWVGSTRLIDNVQLAAAMASPP